MMDRCWLGLDNGVGVLPRHQILHEWHRIGYSNLVSSPCVLLKYGLEVVSLEFACLILCQVDVPHSEECLVGMRCVFLVKEAIAGTVTLGVALEDTGDLVEVLLELVVLGDSVKEAHQWVEGVGCHLLPVDWSTRSHYWRWCLDFID